MAIDVKQFVRLALDAQHAEIGEKLVKAGIGINTAKDAVDGAAEKKDILRAYEAYWARVAYEQGLADGAAAEAAATSARRAELEKFEAGQNAQGLVWAGQKPFVEDPQTDAALWQPAAAVARTKFFAEWEAKKKDYDLKKPEGAEAYQRDLKAAMSAAGYR